VGILTREPYPVNARAAERVWANFSGE
jgi:hypothetical protein